MYAFVQTVYIMYGVSEMYTSLLYNTHNIVVHIRINFSAESLIALHSIVQSSTQFVDSSDYFFQYIPL